VSVVSGIVQVGIGIAGIIATGGCSTPFAMMVIASGLDSIATGIAGYADGVVHDSAIGHAVSQDLQSVGVNETIAEGVGTLVPMLMGGLNPFRCPSPRTSDTELRTFG
jgi:hypothetical protein